MGAKVAIGMGANVGDRWEAIRLAAVELAKLLASPRLSPVYETAPKFVEDQPPFLNAVMVGESAIGPLALLDALKEIERRLGRLPRERYGPREIDLDLLAFGRLRLDSERLTIPHPGIAERRFVLAPWADLTPDWILPLPSGLATVAELLERTPDPPDAVRRLENQQPAWNPQEASHADL
ncbi:MAG: 2-amino-4-hydroxy-6-hydroxymethyldihydropteridine diphosphokinase [Fimbriimonadales bacterium]